VGAARALFGKSVLVDANGSFNPVTAVGAVQITSVGGTGDFAFNGGIASTGGDIGIANAGAITTTAALTTSGAVSVTAGASLTIGGAINAGGNVVLKAAQFGNTA